MSFEKCWNRESGLTADRIRWTEGCGQKVQSATICTFKFRIKNYGSTKRNTNHRIRDAPYIVVQTYNIL